MLSIMRYEKFINGLKYIIKMKMPNGLMSKLASVIIPVTLATTIATTNLIFQFASAQSQQQEQDLSTLFSGEVKHRGRTYDLSIYEDRNKEMSYKIKAKDSWEIDKNLIPKILCYALSKK